MPPRTQTMITISDKAKVVRIDKDIFNEDSPY